MKWFQGAYTQRFESMFGEEGICFRVDTRPYPSAQIHGKAALKELTWKEEYLLAARSVVPEKQAVAWLIKSHTAVTGRWIAERLHMGHPENASHGINRFRRVETTKIQNLKKRILKCVGLIPTAFDG
jgi:hypothetical protein